MGLQKVWFTFVKIKFSFLLSLLLLQNFRVAAQLYDILREEFNDHKNGWVVNGKKNPLLILEKGQLEVTNTQKEHSILISRYIPGNKDFSIETTLTQSELHSNKGVGIIWRYEGLDGSNFLLISDQSTYSISLNHNNKKGSLNWKPSEFIKPVGRSNTLKIEQHNGRLTFYINKYIVKEMKGVLAPLDTVGLVVFSGAKILVDNFYLRSESKINIPYPLTCGLVKENLGKAINSAYEDLGPIVSADGKTLYFSRKGCPDNIGGVNDREDLWFSKSEDGLSWSNSRNMGRYVNSKSADNLAAVSTDNNTMMFAVGNGDYAFTHRTVNGWSARKVLGLNISNETSHREAWLSADGNAIIFTSKLKSNIHYRKDVNERDIFVCEKREDGTWSPPINLGPVINSARDESSPFLASDGRTLYFASDGHPGYGNQDVFVSRRIGQGWSTWSEPVNLGPEINTPDFDAYYTIPASGEYAYMVSTDNSLGKSDIIRIRLPFSIKPDPVALIYGKTIDARTKQPIQAKISFPLLEDTKAVGEAMSDPLTGDYQLVLQPGKKYMISAFAKGYMTVNEDLELIIHQYQEFKKDLYLIPLKVGNALPVRNVFFEQGKATLKSESYVELDYLVKLLKENPGMQMRLEGHTDNVGNTNSLIELSQQRTISVKDYLVKKGIQPGRLSVKGYGATKPLEKNDTEEGRKRNRRVEFIITEM